ncbi:NAD(P)-dependent oxidoreductase [Sphingomonas aerolata]|uniref:NAD(P)-dependent oxidoreductase n=1 Tax=Sphingomonas aerolata TaxID=185951 RepID=UPI002FE28A17
MGLGAIGKAVARRLAAFDVPIAYHGRSRQADVGYDYYDTPVALAAACDVLIAIVPGGQGTQHLVDAAVLEALGAQGVFINVARGSVVDQDALIAALQQGTILAAGLDVYEDEPNVPVSLRALPNTVLLPHHRLGVQSGRARLWAGWWSTICANGSRPAARSPPSRRRPTRAEPGHRRTSAGAPVKSARSVSVVRL